MLENIDKNIKHTHAWLTYLDTVDSTNNYAMQAIQDGLAQHGNVIMARNQENGKGQRGKQWQSKAGEGVFMSLILNHNTVTDIFHLSFLIPVAVRHVLQSHMPECQVCIKWPNDIYVNDKKIAGILIENVFRGMSVKHSVIGIGVNVMQTSFMLVDTIPTSIFLETNQQINLVEIVAAIRTQILQSLGQPLLFLKATYNEFLWKKACLHTFTDAITTTPFTAKIIGVDENFDLKLEHQPNITNIYRHGSVQW